MAYWYSAYTIDKRIVQGTIDAVSERMAEEALYRAGYNRVLKLRETRPGLDLGKLMPTFFGVKTPDVIDFSHQLATLVESGIPILTALQLLEEQSPTAALRKIIAGLARELQEGNSLSQALAGYPQVFSNTYCQVIKASEATGNIEVALKRMADYLEKETAARKKIGHALAYPALVLLMAVGVFTLLTTVALPPLVKLFNSLGAELPWTTRLLLFTGELFLNYKFYLLGALAALTISLFGYLRLPSGRLAKDKFILKIPVVNSISVQRNIYRFCQTASMLLTAGLPLPQILNTAARTVENVIIRQALEKVREKLVQGQSLSQSMAGIPVFPHLLVEMIIVGETTGTLDNTLATMGDYYEQRIEQRVQTLISMIEPTLIIVAGLVVAFIAISIITPLYSVLRSIH